jgi:hypothetical protein
MRKRTRYDQDKTKRRERQDQDLIEAAIVLPEAKDPSFTYNIGAAETVLLL